MSTAPVTSVTDELLAELELAANYCVAEVIRSHPWKDHEFDLLHADERFVRAASPDLVVGLLSELRRLRAENAELSQSLAESRANDQAAMGWLTSLRWASGDRGERMLPELVTHIEGLAEDAGRYRQMRDVVCHEKAMTPQEYDEVVTKVLSIATAISELRQ